MENPSISRHRRRWTEDEISYLETSWGKFKVSTIAKNLKRTIPGIKMKASKLRLGEQRKSLGMMTGSQISSILGSPRGSFVSSWVRNKGLKAKKLQYNSKTSKHVYLIDLDDFWEWAGNHKHLINTTKFKEGDLGVEPEWMKKKRKEDARKKVPKRNLKPWTEDEEREAFKLFFGSMYNLEEIASRLKRGQHAVRAKISFITRLKPEDITINPINNNKPWSMRELLALIYCKNRTQTPVKVIAYYLNRSYSSVYKKYEELYYERINNNKYWTGDEIQLLVSLYNTGKFYGTDLAMLLRRGTEGTRTKIKHLTKTGEYGMIGMLKDTKKLKGSRVKNEN